MNNLSLAVSGTNEANEAKALLLASGIAAMQNRAAFLPLQTSDSLPETETEFSERTRASRQSRWMRITKYLQFLAFKHWGMELGLPLTAFPQIEAVIYGENEEKK